MRRRAITQTPRPRAHTGLRPPPSPGRHVPVGVGTTRGSASSASASCSALTSMESMPAAMRERRCSRPESTHARPARSRAQRATASHGRAMAWVCLAGPSPGWVATPPAQRFETIHRAGSRHLNFRQGMRVRGWRAMGGPALRLRPLEGTQATGAQPTSGTARGAGKESSRINLLLTNGLPVQHAIGPAGRVRPDPAAELNGASACTFLKIRACRGSVPSLPLPLGPEPCCFRCSGIA